ncbi:MAG: putative metal-binding motif-containing protein, partial [Myxococcales bacterium]|nr:putative metal-binding motif-containing protein [Myxococcales bacterium]
MSPASYDALRGLVPLTLLVGLVGCGARTGLEGEAVVGASDAGVDAGPPCAPGPEVCNGRDDDCDGRFDEGLGFGEVRHVVVRSTEGTTGPCSTCQWAAGPQLFVHPAGLLAVWRMGFDGSHPQPNAWARRLDRDATPIGEPFVLFDDVQVPNGFRLAPV